MKAQHQAVSSKARGADVEILERFVMTAGGGAAAIGCTLFGKITPFPA